MTALQLQIENGSPDIATLLKPKRKCVDLSLPGVPVSCAWDEPEMKQRLITASAYLRDYPLGIKSSNDSQSVMSIPVFMDALIQVESATLPQCRIQYRLYENWKANKSISLMTTHIDKIEHFMELNPVATQIEKVKLCMSEKAKRSAEKAAERAERSAEI